MKPLTYQDRIKFEAIKETVLDLLKDNNYTTFNITYETLCGMVESAKRKNKINNQLLKYEDFDSIVSNFYVKDENTDECNWYSVRANKIHTVKLLFIYEVLNDQYATKQCFSHFKNNVA